MYTGKVLTALIGEPNFVTFTTLTNAKNLGVIVADFFFSQNCKKYPNVSIGYQGQFGTKYQSNEIIATLAFHL